MIRTVGDLSRELTKVLDVLEVANRHFKAEGEMNAALHMAATVRPAPLATAVETARDDVKRLIEELYPDGVPGSSGPSV